MIPLNSAKNLSSNKILGRLDIGKRFQLLAFVPIYQPPGFPDEGTSDLKGLGDAALMVNYKVFATTNRDV